jgi:hypothetical protein
MFIRSALGIAVFVSGAAVAHAQAPVTPGLPPPQVVPPPPATPAPGSGDAQAPPASPGSQPPAQVPAAPVAPVPAQVGRVFTAPTGLLFNSVRPERVADFETVIWYLQQALQQSTDPTVQAQAKGWRVMRAAEPGPNGTIVFVFLLDPTVPNADYGLGRILADAYPDKIQEIWRLYQGAVTGGGSLLNLMPVTPTAPQPLAAPAPPVAPAARTPPPAAP